MSEALDYLIDRAAFGIRAAVTLEQLRALHQPVDRDGPTPQACRACVAGYDPQTGDLVYCAWPCMTRQIIDAQ